MAKVTTSHGGQVEHQTQMCARANGRDANHPDDLQRGARTSTGGKAEVPGWHVAVTNVHTKKMCL